MKKTISILFILVFHVVVMNAQPSFYNAKCYIVGLTTNDDIYKESIKTSKFFNNYIGDDGIPCVINQDGTFNPTATKRKLEEKNFGKRTLDLLFERDKGQLSEELLNQRAWKNVQLSDRERARHAVISQENVLKEDILPILESNYILITHIIKDNNGYLSAKSWIVFHVDIDQKTWDEVNRNWNNLQAYDKIPVGISYVASGKAHASKTKQKLSGFIGGEAYNIHDDPVLKDISKKVPFLAVHGQIVSKNPYSAVFENIVVQDGERIRVYRQEQDKNGEYKSKEIGKAVGRLMSKDNFRLYPIAGQKGDPKKGDLAVLSPSSRISNTLLWQNQSYTSELRYILGITAVDYGAIYVTYDFELRGGWLKKDDKDTRYLVGENKDSLINSPKYGKFGLGGSYMFRTPITGFDIGPYFLIQGEVWFASYKEVIDWKRKTYSEIDKSKAWVNGGLRIPLGIKANLNIWYPLRIQGGIEWAPMILGGKELKHNVLESRDWKSGELSWFVGLRLDL